MPKHTKKTRAGSRIHGLLVGYLLMGLLGSCSVRTYYIVRHADRVPGQDALTAAGEERTRVLADSLRTKKITSIFSTNTLRTRRTATPLAEAINVPVETYDYTNPATQAAALTAFAQRLKVRKNSLIVGHSNTILDLVKALGATPSAGAIGEGEFDRLFVVKRTKRWPASGTQVRLQEKRYGAVAH